MNELEPALIQTASGLSTTHGIGNGLTITTTEKLVLQNLAKQVAELAAKPIEKEKAELWTLHNDLQPTRPLVFCDPENGWNEIITAHQLRCKSPLLRVWEMHLRKEIHWATEFCDDKVIEPYFNVPYNYSETGFGVEIKKITGNDDGGSFVYDCPVKNYEKDLNKLHFSEIKVDYKKTNGIFQLAKTIFDDILTVRLKGVWWWSLGLTWEFISLRGLENLMVDMMMYPDDVHQLMNFLSRQTLRKLDFLEQNNLLALNTEGTYVGSGGFGWTKQLPQPDFQPEKVRTIDMWGFCESQETVGVSPEMFAEFIFPYQLPILKRFGINCYGCCEPLDTRWHIVKEIPRLRRVSVSPWANVEKMAQQLENKYIYSKKPSPTDIAVPNPDWDRIRKELRSFLKTTRNCHTEIIMKDNHTLGNNPANASRWCKIAMEEAMRI